MRVIRAGVLTPVQIFSDAYLLDTLSLFSSQTTILMCSRALAVSMLATRFFLFPRSEPALRGM
jgi:hypothetical protein